MYVAAINYLQNNLAPRDERRPSPGKSDFYGKGRDDVILLLQLAHGSSAISFFTDKLW